MHFNDGERPHMGMKTHARSSWQTLFVLTLMPEEVCHYLAKFVWSLNSGSFGITACIVDLGISRRKSYQKLTCYVTSYYSTTFEFRTFFRTTHSFTVVCERIASLKTEWLGTEFEASVTKGL